MIALGIDPGVSGGLAVLVSSREGIKVTTHKMPQTERDTWELIRTITIERAFGHECHCVIEQMVPRPTRFFNKQTHQWTQSILKSTCVLYGGYQALRAMLIAANISFEPVMPQLWQRALGIPQKEKTDSDNKWKNKLKAKAQQLFPETKVTLLTADSLLIAEFCRRRFDRAESLPLRDPGPVFKLKPKGRLHAV